MASDIVILCCQGLKSSRNSTPYQRANLLTSKYNTIILSRDPVCDDLAESAHQVRRAPDTGFIRVFYPFWLILQITILRQSQPIEHVHTTFSAQTLLAGAIVGAFGETWIADIWDDPRLGLDIEGRPTDPFRYVARLYNRSLLWMVRRSLSRAELIIVALVPPIFNSYGVALVPTILKSYGVDPEDKNVLSVTNGVDVNYTQARRDAVDADFQDPEMTLGGNIDETNDSSPFRILYLGPIRQARGLETLCDSLEKVQTNQQVTIRLVGNTRTQDKVWFREYWESTDIENVTVQLIGEVKHDLALAEIDRADVCLCLLSPTVRNYHYAYPIKVFEYMALGKPIICTRMDGTERILTDGETGILVPPTDPSALATALDRFCSSPELRRQLGETARMTVPQYDWNQINQQIDDRLSDAVRDPDR